MPVVTESLAKRLQATMRGQVLADAPLAPYTSFRIGGPATLLATPTDREDLKRALHSAVKQRVVAEQNHVIEIHSSPIRRR